MEKYARQYIAEGIARATDLVINDESELYKVLTQHYNRNNHVQVAHTNQSPHSFSYN